MDMVVKNIKFSFDEAIVLLFKKTKRLLKKKKTLLLKKGDNAITNKHG